MIDWESDKTRVELAELEGLIELHGRDCRVVRWVFAYRNLRNKIWWQWRRRLLSYLHKGPPKDNRPHIFWYLRGGIGDVAVHRVCVQAWRKKFPQAVFYYQTATAGAAEMLFEQDEKNIIIHGREPLWYKYDAAFEVCLSFRTVHWNQKRVRQVAPEMEPVLQEGLRRQAKLGFFLRDNYQCDDVLGRWMHRHQLPQLELRRYLSGIDFDVNETGLLPLSLRDPSILKKYDLQGKKYITIHSGLSVSMPLFGKAPLKCWPTEKWREFVRLFKQQYPSVLVVQLGGPNSPHFDFADKCLVGKTPLTDVAAILDNAWLHVDGESGFTQMMRWLQTKAVVFFAHTSPAMFALAKNINLAASVCTPCMWLTGGRWYIDCLCGYKTCQNLDAITAQQVFEAVRKTLK